jgi:hypothetical protein
VFKVTLIKLPNYSEKLLREFAAKRTFRFPLENSSVRKGTREMIRDRDGRQDLAGGGSPGEPVTPFLLFPGKPGLVIRKLV